MKLLSLLLFFPMMATAALPSPIPITQPVYAIQVPFNIQFNYTAPYLWVRFILNQGSGLMYYCYKVDPTVPPVSTNGWMNASDYWLSGRWVPTTNVMSEADRNWCWNGG